MRRNSTRRIVLILSFITILSILSNFVGVKDVYAVDKISKYVFGTIVVNGSITINIDGTHNKKYIVFSPAEDGYYQIYSEQDEVCEADIYEKVVTDEGVTLDGNCEDIRIYTYSGSDIHNKNILISGYFLKGKEYYVEPEFSRGNRFGNITLYCKADLLDINIYEPGGEMGSNIDYCGTEVNLSENELVYTYTDKKTNKYVYRSLKYGTDWITTGYTIDDKITSDYLWNYMGDSIEWKSGLPKEKGEYIFKLKGIGKYRGTKYVRLKVRSRIDVNNIDAEELKYSGQEITIPRVTMKYMAIRPSKTATYTVDSSTGDVNKNSAGLNIYGYLYDKNGTRIGKNSRDSRNFRIKADLVAGEVYYFRMYTSTEYKKYDEKTGKNEIYYPDYQKVIISIPGYEYKAPAQQVTTASNTPVKTDETNNPLAKGKTFVSGNVQYKVTTSSKGKYQVAVVKNKNKKAKKITIGASVKYKGITYQITSIGSKAFAGSKNLTTVSVGKSVTSIGASAFSGCSKLSKVTVTSTGLKKIGSNAFKGISKKAVILVPRKQLKKYTKLFKGCKVASTVKIKAK